MSDMDEFRDMFFVECSELLEGLATGLRQMDEPGHDKETVHAVFRAVHSIKGGAAAFALDDLVTFAHRFETVLDLVRSDKLEADAQVMPIMHRCSDCLADLVTDAQEGRGSNSERCETLLGELDRLIGNDEDDGGIVFTPLAIDIGPVGGDDSGESDFVPTTISFEPEGYEIRFVPNADLYRSGNDPVALLYALSKFGEIEIDLDPENIPVLEDWTEDEVYLQWKISLKTDEDQEEIAAIFEFVEDCCILEITPIGGDDTPPEPDNEAVPDIDGSGQDSVEIDIPASEPPTTTESAPPPPLAKPAASPRPAPEASQPAATIRVNLDRIDKLMNMIGELVIKEAMLAQVIQTAGLIEDPDVVAGLDSIRQLAGDIQESVMAIRAQPLKLVFQRMHRILREAAEATGKQVRLDTIGEQTEVDKTMVERLIDPLTHMIRNSVDHGLEDAVTRQRRNKPQEGVITLSAAHRSGRVQIEVSDDGGGINRPKVLQIAEERGLVAPGAVLSASEIDQLLFLPGFSSKDEVSALSGRGVGLDVVRREIMELGGRVMIHSTEGEGTTFAIALPLTLAVLEGMLIQLCGQTMVLPITAVQETLRPNPSILQGVGQNGRLLSNRGALIPIIDLGCTFGLRHSPAPLDDGVLIIVETDSQKRAAFHVDGIFDQRQVVIKSLEENYGRVSGVSAATILGDGKIALIVDPEEIVLSLSNDHGRSATSFAANW